MTKSRNAPVGAVSNDFHGFYELRSIRDDLRLQITNNDKAFDDTKPLPDDKAKGLVRVVDAHYKLQKNLQR